MGRKYILTDETFEISGCTLHRIKAVRDFGNVCEGELGGFIQSENNLSHEGDAWVYHNAKVYGEAIVYDDAVVYDDARVHGDARVYNNAAVFGNAEGRIDQHTLTHFFLQIGCGKGRYESTLTLANKNDVLMSLLAEVIDNCLQVAYFVED